jgi:hypothetical protein
MTRFFLTVAAVSTAFGTSALAADEHIGRDHNQIEGVRGDVHGSVSSFGVFGTGARAEFPIVPNGLVGGAYDEVALSLGADLFFAELNPGWYNDGLYVVPIAALQWNFYVSDHWSIFPEAGVAFLLDPDDRGWNGHDGVYVAPNLGFGARYHFASRNALLLRASTPGGVQVGLTF